MTPAAESNEKLSKVLSERAALEERLQNEKGEMPDATVARYEKAYATLQRSLGRLFKEAPGDAERITVMLEMLKILENRLVYLQNFSPEPAQDEKMLAQLVSRFIDELAAEHRSVLTPLEATYYRGIAALYAGDLTIARESFQAACASEESDEANDIKYKAYVILGNLSHQQSDFQEAKKLHDESMKYSHHRNVTAQALAFRALNSYALKDLDGALALFEEALGLFDRNEPFFNSYFHRNSLLFCGSIHFDRREFQRAESCYREVLGVVESHSYDSFDALSQLGRVCYSTSRFDEAAEHFRKAIETHKLSENESLVDTYYWLARTHLKRNDKVAARPYLEKIAASSVQYDKRPQAEAMLRQVS